MTVKLEINGVAAIRKEHSSASCACAADNGGDGGSRSGGDSGGRSLTTWARMFPEARGGEITSATHRLRATCPAASSLGISPRLVVPVPVSAPGWRTPVLVQASHETGPSPWRNRRRVCPVDVSGKAEARAGVGICMGEFKMDMGVVVGTRIGAGAAAKTFCLLWVPDWYWSAAALLARERATIRKEEDTSRDGRYGEESTGRSERTRRGRIRHEAARPWSGPAVVRDEETLVKQENGE
ncbi:hypothetical protein DFH94DRAFT_678221 [Russula ochroleuca]|uniref:Uncharacterized protein n=1 Tax=Russula ochroleuca TaxID=152965 RepID=A0A9P5TEQ5_9AGAM|nr:hypothetical protein DFH94DRAFT_678221 [Russula ochroleuca]